MISKKTEDRIIELLHDASADDILNRDDLEPETRHTLEKLAVLEEDLQNVDELFPPVPEFQLPREEAPSGSRSNFWYFLPAAAMLIFGFFFFYQPEAEEVFRGGVETQGNIDDVFQAVASGDVVVLEQHLQSGAPINGLNQQGQTPLMLAAREDDVPMLEILIQFGAALDLTDARGMTALMIAAGEGHLESTRLLMEQGADPNLKDNQGATAMDLARENDYQEVLSILTSF